MRTEPSEPVTPIVEDNTYRGTLIREARFTGLTKREYFAATAMQGICAGVPSAHYDPQNIAKYSVDYADALINELNKKP